VLDVLDDILTSGCHFHRSTLDMQWRNKSNEHTHSRAKGRSTQVDENFQCRWKPAI